MCPPALGPDGWGSIWPNNNWYKSYQDASAPAYRSTSRISISAGRISAAADSTGIRSRKGKAYNAKISQQRGSHFLKAGFEHRRGYGRHLRR